MFGWYGAAGSLPGVFLVLVPAAANAGTALAIANAIVDMERDDAAGIESIALALGSAAVGLAGASGSRGSSRSWRWRPRRSSGPRPGWALAVLLTACVPLAGAIVGLVAIYRGGGPGWRELAWEIQAVGAGPARRRVAGALSAASAATPPA